MYIYIYIYSGHKQRKMPVMQKEFMTGTMDRESAVILVSVR